MPIIIVILMTSAILNACYFFPLLYPLFKKGDFTPVKGAEAPVSMLLLIAVLAPTSIVVGIRLDLTIPLQDVARYLF